MKPSYKAILEARKYPSGYVYVLDERYDSNGRVPEYGIKGCWKVDSSGKIIMPFIQNSKYDSEKVENCAFVK